MRVGGQLSIWVFYLWILFSVIAKQIGAVCCTVYGAGKQAKYRIIAKVKNKVNRRFPSSKNSFTKIYLTVSLIYQKFTAILSFRYI